MRMCFGDELDAFPVRGREGKRERQEENGKRDEDRIRVSVCVPRC